MTFDSPQGWDCAVLPTDCIAAPVTAAPVTTQAVVAPVTTYADHADAAAALVTSNADAAEVNEVNVAAPVTVNVASPTAAPVTMDAVASPTAAPVTMEAVASSTRAWSTIMTGLNYMQVMAHPDMKESIITSVKKAYSSIAGTSPEQISVDLAPGSIVVKITGNLPVSMTQTFEASLAKATGEAVAGIAGIDQVATGAIVGLTCGQGGCGTQQQSIFAASGSMPDSIRAAQQAGVAAALMGASAIQLQQPVLYSVQGVMMCALAAMLVSGAGILAFLRRPTVREPECSRLISDDLAYE